ncbi:MAG TPA: hypothetical protein VGE62_00600 [Candidatus Paceibacterota bacterium]
MNTDTRSANVRYNLAINRIILILGTALLVGGVTFLYFFNVNILFCLIPAAGVMLRIAYGHFDRMIEAHQANKELDPSRDTSHTENMLYWMCHSGLCLISVPFLLDSVVKDKLQVLFDFAGSTDVQKAVFALGVASSWFFWTKQLEYKKRLARLTGKIPGPLLLLTWPDSAGAAVPIPGTPTKEPVPTGLQ